MSTRVWGVVGGVAGRGGLGEERVSAMPLLYVARGGERRAGQAVLAAAFSLLVDGWQPAMALTSAAAATTAKTLERCRLVA